MEMDALKQKQKERREELYGLLGRLPDRNLQTSCRIVETVETEHYTLEKLVLEFPDDTGDLYCESIPVYFVRPKGDGPFPAVLFNHSHGGLFSLGKKELLQPAPYMYSTPYAEALASRGIAVLAIDRWCFGERSGCSEEFLFRRMLLDGEVLWGRILYDSLKAFDYLCTRPDVDASRIAALGMSMGSTMAWWLAALEERIKVCVDICCLSDYDEMIRQGTLDGHSIYYFVPGLRRHFSSADINALIAPRPHLGTVGIYDVLTPIAGVERIEKEVSEVYEAFGSGENFRISRYPNGHLESAAMRAEILDYLDKYL